jgi:acetyl esterase
MRAVLPPISSTELDAAEARRRAGVRAEIAGPRPVPEAEVYDTSVPFADRSVRVRFHRPQVKQPTEERGAVILYLHPGGWVTGGLDLSEGTCRRLAVDNGAVVVALDYSLAPEHPYPVALDETLAALRWLESEGPAHGLDPRRMVIAGESAGGNLALAALLRLRDAGAPLPVNACLLIVPVVDHDATRESYSRHDRGEIDKRSGMHWYMRQYLPDFDDHVDDPYVWPLRAPSLKGLPPIIMVSVEYDPLFDEQCELERRLEEAGSPVEHLHYDGVTHGFFALDHLEPISRQAQLDVASRLVPFLIQARPDA